MVEGVPLREALGLSALDGVRVLAGASGLGRTVRYVNVMEVPDILDWVKPDELLLTTTYPLRDDRAALAELVPRLAQRGLAGLAVKPARYIDDVPQVMREAADRLDFPLLELPPQTALADIINAVLGLILNQQAVRLTRSAAVHERFTAIVLSGGGAREIAQALADLIDRPVALLDLQGDVLARTADFEIDPAHWPALVDGLEPGPLRWVKLPRSGRALSAAIQPIQAGPDVHGATVVLAEPDGVVDDELMAIEHASTVAALRLVQARAVAEADRRFQATCLDELVTGHLTEWAVLHERAVAFGWDLTVPRGVLVAEIDTVGGRRFAELAGTVDERRARTRLADAARASLGREAIIWERSAGIASLTRAEDMINAARALHAAAAAGQPAIGTSIGVGQTYSNPFELRASFTEALRALMVGRRAGSATDVYVYEALGLSRLLLSCPQPELSTFHDDVLGRLLAYERGHSGCDLLVTLEVFLAANRNAAAAARALFVHYNTVRYRLERLEQLVGPFVDDAGRCLTLDLALHAGRLLTAAHMNA